jgi:two-component system, NarL family, nitrate/nitrite response regulator NarL
MLRRLSKRERDVAELVAQGLCNKTIAKRLGITESCVKAHVKHIFEKKNFQNRTQPARAAGE